MDGRKVTVWERGDGHVDEGWGRGTERAGSIRIRRSPGCEPESH